jgi:hypothetical protein
MSSKRRTAMAYRTSAATRIAGATLLVVFTAGLCGGLAGCGKRSPASVPGTTWDSIKTLPDFSGWWAWQYTDAYRGRGPEGKPKGLPQMMLKAPLKPEVGRFLGGVLARIDDTSNRKELFGANNACLPPYFFGLNGGPIHQFEILFTPGRATIADEMGLVRRVSLGQSRATDMVESNAGTSVGHWEQDTLVVETTGIDHSRSFAITPFRIGKGVHVVERWRLREADLLEISVELTAPDILSAPFKDTFLYKRSRDHEFTDSSACAESDRSIDHAARKEQLDLTPPDDLPPPPAE